MATGRLTFAHFESSDEKPALMTIYYRGNVQECTHREAVDEGELIQLRAFRILHCVKVSEYYKAALASANDTDSPSVAFFPAVG